MLRSRQTICVAVLLAGLFGFEALSQEIPPETPQVQSEQQPNGAAKSQPQSSQQTNPTDQNPAVEQHNTGENAERQTDSDAEKRAEEAREYWPFHIFGARLKITDSLLALFTFLLIVVGGIQGVFLYRTDQGTHKAADAAKVSAEAAMASVEIAKLELRADLVLKSAIMENFETIPVTTVELINSGRSSAKDVSFWLTMGFRPIPPPAGSFKKPKEIITSKTDLGPQRIVISTVSFDRQPSKEEFDMLTAGDAALFVFGEAVYTDTFGDITTLPVRLATGGPYGPLPPNGKLAICEEGNTAT
jgi:hypothetical protein